MEVVREGSDLLVKVDEGADSVRILDWYASTQNRLEWLYFADGSTWGADTLTAQGQLNIQIQGTVQDDELSAPSAANGHLFGNEGNDTLLGGAGADTLVGNAGDDYLAGGLGDDTYRFGMGDGSDRVSDAGGEADTLNLTGLRHDQIWFWADGNDLTLGLIGTMDRLTIEQWYSSEDRVVEEISTSGDGYTLMASQLSQLVSAMATFDVPRSGELSISANIEDQMSAAIAAAWQAS